MVLMVMISHSFAVCEMFLEGGTEEDLLADGVTGKLQRNWLDHTS